MGQHSPSTVSQPPPSIGGPPDLAPSGSVSGFAPADQDLSVKRAKTFRSGRGPDYRLRGLELGNTDPDQLPTQTVRKDRLRRRRRRRIVATWMVVLTVAALAAVLLRASVVQPFSVPSAAMVPTLHVGDRILVLKSSRLEGPIQSGNIVVFRHPRVFPCKAARDQAPDLVQRVIGLPGDTVWSVGQKIYVNGKPLHEQGWYDSKYGQVGTTPIPHTKTPSGEYFVLGDNRSESCDSRVFGPIARSLIVGKVIAVLVRDGHLYFHFF